MTNSFLSNVRWILVVAKDSAKDVRAFVFNGVILSVLAGLWTSFIVVTISIMAVAFWWRRVATEYVGDDTVAMLKLRSIRNCPEKGSLEIERICSFRYLQQLQHKQGVLGSFTFSITVTPVDTPELRTTHSMLS